MSETLTVRTNFEDISSLAEGLVDRVDGQRLMLYGPEPYEAGDVISFSVLLLDGTPAMIGSGRVATYIDGGEDRPPEARFDVVLDSLELEGRSEVVYERVVLARESFQGNGDPSTGQVNVQELEAEEQRRADEAASADGYAWPGETESEPYQPETSDPSAYDADDSYEDASADADEVSDSFQSAGGAGGYAFEEEAELPPHAEESTSISDSQSFAPAFGGHDDREEVASDDDFSEGYPPPEAGFEARSPRPPIDVGTGEVAFDEIEDFESSPVDSRVSAPTPTYQQGPLGRPSRQASWMPEAAAQSAPRPRSGLFDYEPGQLPIPTRPPRPDIDPSLRVARAAKPQEGAEAVRSSAPPSAGWDGEYGNAHDESNESPVDGGVESLSASEPPDWDSDVTSADDSHEMIHGSTPDDLSLADAADEDDASFGDVDAEIRRE